MYPSNKNGIWKSLSEDIPNGSSVTLDNTINGYASGAFVRQTTTTGYKGIKTRRLSVHFERKVAFLYALFHCGSLSWGSR